MIAQLSMDYITWKPSKVFPRLLSYFFFEGRPATTRGRWFNPITMLSLRTASRSSLREEAESPVFITGTGRSGSTILGLVLSMHRDVGFLNEPKALWHVVNPNDDLIGSYTLNHASYFLDETDAIEPIASKVKSIYSSFIRLSGSSKIVDKFPEMIFRIEFLLKLFENPRFIFLYRNPVDTILSTARWSEEHKDIVKHEDWWGVNKRKWKLLVTQVVVQDEYLSPYLEEIAGFTNAVDMAAVEWIVTMNQGLKMMEQYPEHILPVKFEDLTSQPAITLRDICSFCGLHEEQKFISFGMKALKLKPAKKEIDVHPLLRDSLEKLSKKLGY